MNIKINSVHFDADTKLKNFIHDKIEKLSQFYDEFIDIEVFLRLNNTQGQENKVAEIKMNIPGNELFVDKQSKTFEQAIDDCIDSLKRQIKRHKEKKKRP